MNGNDEGMMLWGLGCARRQFFGVSSEAKNTHEKARFQKVRRGCNDVADVNVVYGNYDHFSSRYWNYYFTLPALTSLLIQVKSSWFTV